MFSPKRKSRAARDPWLHLAFIFFCMVCDGAGTALPPLQYVPNHPTSLLRVGVMNQASSSSRGQRCFRFSGTQCPSSFNHIRLQLLALSALKIWALRTWFWLVSSDIQLKMLSTFIPSAGKGSSPEVVWK